MKIAYFDCFSGISGDMILGALIDAGLGIDKLIENLTKLNLKYKIISKKISKNGIAGTSVTIPSLQEDTPRTPGQVIKIINDSKLELEIKTLSKNIFTKLAKAEAKIHSNRKDSLHLHELGSIDTIIDIVGTVIGIKLLDIDEIYSSPLPVSRGYVKCAHGILPVPAPATAELLKGIPVYGSNISAELVTPTGAAIITTLAKSIGKLPEMNIDKIAYGAGKKELEIPNLLRVFIGTSVDEYIEDTVIIVETNIDNMNPELYEYVITKLFDAGALDVYLTPVQMKKNRPGIILSSIVEEKDLNKIIETVFNETTSLGIRTYKVSRFKLRREERIINTKYGKIKIKIGKIGNTIKNIAPEYESCKKIAEKLNLPLKNIYSEVNRGLRRIGANSLAFKNNFPNIKDI